MTDEPTPPSAPQPGRRRAVVPPPEVSPGPPVSDDQTSPYDSLYAPEHSSRSEPASDLAPARQTSSSYGHDDTPTADTTSTSKHARMSDSGDSKPAPAPSRSRKAAVSGLGKVGHFVREVVIIIVVALVASALLRAFVVQAFFVPSGSMLPTIQVHDRILVSRIGDIQRGEVVVFEDPGNWIPPQEQPPAPSGIRKFMEFIGVLPNSGHEHLVKRVIGLPGDHVVCCSKGKLVINGVPVDESAFIKPGTKAADNVKFNVVVPADHIFVLGDNRYVSGDSSRHLTSQEAFVPESLVTGRAFAVIWPRDNIQVLHIPSAYDDVPPGASPPPKEGSITNPQSGKN